METTINPNGLAHLKDSGQREEMATGSKRDSRTGKGRFDLLPGRAVVGVIELRCHGSPLWDALKSALQVGSVMSGLRGNTVFNHAVDVVNLLFRFMEHEADPGVCSEYSHFPNALFRVARIFEAGAIKYDSRNWELGQPLSRYLDSGTRHIVCYMRGDRDEDHVAQAAWNFLCLLETCDRIMAGLLPAELDDLPTAPSGRRYDDEPVPMKRLRDSVKLKPQTT
jgi:hypothetical protein